MLLCCYEHQFQLVYSMKCVGMIWKSSTASWNCSANDSLLVVLLWEQYKFQPNRSLAHSISEPHLHYAHKIALRICSGCTSLASNVSNRNLTIGTTCAPRSDNENGVSSVCWENRCRSKFMLTLKMCRSRFLDVGEGCLGNHQCDGVRLSRRSNEDATVY